MNKLMFNYAAGLDEQQENLVLAFHQLVTDFRANKSNTEEYKENNRKFTDGFMSYCVESTGKKYSGLDMVKNPQLSMHNTAFTENFATMLAQMITPVVPEVLSGEFSNLWDVQQVGWGN